MEDPDQVNRIIVCDMMGQTVEIAEKSEIKNEVMLGASLKPNIYIVKVYGTNFTKSFKVIKKQ